MTDLEARTAKSTYRLLVFILIVKEIKTFIKTSEFYGMVNLWSQSPASLLELHCNLAYTEYVMTV